MKALLRKMNVLTLCSLALVALAQPVHAADQEIELKGEMPLWKMLLAGDWQTPDEIEKLCKGSANGSELAKCLQAEIQTADGGNAFLDLFGGVLPLELRRNPHVGRKLGWVGLGVITAGVAPALTHTNDYGRTGKVGGRREYRLEGFTTSRGSFTAVDDNGHLYFKGSRTNDKTKYILIITAR